MPLFHTTGTGEDARLHAELYTVSRLAVTVVTGSTNKLGFQTTTAIPNDALEGLRLHVCDESFDFSAATKSQANKRHDWSAGHLDWSSPTHRTVYLSKPNIKTGRVDFTPGALTVREGGTSNTATYSIRPQRSPGTGARWIVFPLSQDTGAVTVSPRRLDFTEANWETVQQVTVRAVGDADARNERVRVRHHLINSKRGLMNNAPAVQVTVIDDDGPGLTVLPRELGVAEGGSSSYEVTLNTAPSGNVTVTPASGDPAVAAVSGALTFTSGNWRTPQAVTVFGLEDGDAADATTTISHTVSGSYTVATPERVAVTVSDDDRKAVTVSRPSAAVISMTTGPVGYRTSDGDLTGRSSYTVVLGARPSGDVTVTPVSDDPALVGVSGPLTFTRENWYVAQTVTVTGLNPADRSGARLPVTISHTVAGGGYGAVEADDVEIIVWTHGIHIPGKASFSSSGPDCLWKEGEVVQVTFTFTHPVTVDTTGGTPRVSIWFTGGPLLPGGLSGEFAVTGSFSRWANYRSGSGTNELVFSHRLGRVEYGSRTKVSVAGNGLQLNGGTITGAASGAGVSLSHPPSSRQAGRDAQGYFEEALCTTGPALAPVPSTAPGGEVFATSNLKKGGTRISMDIGSNALANSFRAAGALPRARIRLLLAKKGETAPPFTVSIYSDNGGVPGTELAALTAPASLTTTMTAYDFTADGVITAAGTYWVVVRNTSSTAQLSVEAIASLTQDALGAPGWSIGDSVYTLGASGTWTAPIFVQRVFRLAVLTTGPAPWLSAPTEVNVTATADGFRARWRPPAGERAEDSLGRYDLRYRQAADAAWTDGPQYVTGDAVARSGGDAFDRAITVTGGDATKHYEVQVRAYTAVGLTPWSASGLSGSLNATRTARAAPAVTGSPEISAAGNDGQWTSGEKVEVTLTFDEKVAVDTAGGTPSVGLSLGGSVARSAPYVRGSKTTALVFAYTLADADGSHSSMTVTGDSLALNGGTIRSVASGTDVSLSHVGASVLGQSSGTAIGARGQVGEPGGFTARFESLPESNDGSTAFTFELHFSAAPDALSYRAVGGGLLEVSGATVTGARRLTRGSNLGWEVTAEPTRGGDISIRLPARACTEANAVCAGGAPLARAATATVPGIPFTASFSEVPKEHDGESEIELRFSFSEAPADGFGYGTGARRRLRRDGRVHQ